MEYIKWMFDDRAEEFLTRIKSRNYVDCDKVKWDLWKDCMIYCKTKGGGKGKTIYKYYGERFKEYFTELDIKSQRISLIEGCEWELAAILQLELIRNQNPVETLSKSKNEEATTTTAETQMDSILENVEEEDVTHEVYVLIKNEETANVTDSKGKKEIVQTKMRNMARSTRKSIKKKPCCYPTKARRVKRVRNTGTWINCALQFVKCWTMIALSRPYTCAANRYAKFGSNKRFKPGD